jgi:hypothetical protein
MAACNTRSPRIASWEISSRPWRNSMPEQAVLTEPLKPGTFGKNVLQGLKPS